MIYERSSTGSWQDSRYSLCALLYAVTVVAPFCGLGSQLGLLGIALAFDATLLSLLMIQWMKPRGFPVRAYRAWTDGERFVVLMICLVLHALALPSATMNRGSSLVPPPPTPVVPVQPGSPVNVR